MTRHWFASGPFIVALVASTSVAQVYTDLSPGDQHVSQLRPGFQREGIDPAAKRGRIVVAPAPVELVDDSESTPRSFLPKWLDWRKNKTETQPNAKPKANKNTQGKSTAKTAPSPNTDNDPQLPDPAAVQNGALPGLGGTPLPRVNRPHANAGATHGIAANTPSSNSQAAQNTTQSAKSSATAAPGMRMAARDAPPPHRQRQVRPPLQLRGARPFIVRRQIFLLMNCDANFQGLFRRPKHLVNPMQDRPLNSIQMPTATKNRVRQR